MFDGANTDDDGSNDNIITEVLPSGEIYQFDLEVCDDAVDTVLANLYAKEGEVINFDFSTAIFGLFINTIQILSNSGWSTEDLVAEVIEHSDDTDWDGEDDEDEQ